MRKMHVLLYFPDMQCGWDLNIESKVADYVLDIVTFVFCILCVFCVMCCMLYIVCCVWCVLELFVLWVQNRVSPILRLGRLCVSPLGMVFISCFVIHCFFCFSQSLQSFSCGESFPQLLGCIDVVLC